MLTIGLRLTENVMTNEGAARAEPSLLELCRVVTEEDRRSNSLSMQTSVKRKIPHAESPSSVRFRSYHPQKEEFLINSWVIHVAPQAVKSCSSCISCF